MLIDTHCHLDAARFDDDRADTIGRARAAGVERMITIGCDVDNSRRALGIAATHGDIFASVGVHPHEAAKVEPGFIENLRELSAHPRCVAIGECGLDYYYDNSPRAEQREVFAAQIDLAKELGLPLVIHVRDAWDDCLSIMREHDASHGVIHCFTGTVANAEAAVELGFFISIPGIVTFKNPGEVPDAVRRVPLDRLLVETDSPYLAPLPHRGKRNEPAFVAHVAEKVAELREMSVVDVVSQTGENAKRLFKIA